MGFSMTAPKTATFGAGCFWGVEAMFRNMAGVIVTEVGYAGGTTKNPRYEEVCTGKTGHAEVVRLLYDPDEVTYEDLLTHFWSIHDPTQKNRQGPDIGSNYRSVIFYHDPEQKQAAIRSKEEIDRSGRFSRPVVTEILPAMEFWRAEEYHQQYHEKKGGAGCRRI
jgi:peptide-methionine (S)-S-oxide reductase